MDNILSNTKDTEPSEDTRKLEESPSTDNVAPISTVSNSTMDDNSVEKSIESNKITQEEPLTCHIESKNDEKVTNNSVTSHDKNSSPKAEREEHFNKEDLLSAFTANEAECENKLSEESKEETTRINNVEDPVSQNDNINTKESEGMVFNEVHHEEMNSQNDEPSHLPSPNNTPSEVTSETNGATSDNLPMIVSDTDVNPPTSGLALLAAYKSSDESDDNDSNSETNSVVCVTMSDVQEYREQPIKINSDSSSDDDSSDVEVISNAEKAKRDRMHSEIDQLYDDDDDHGTRGNRSLRVKGELLLEDLPPIQDLHITVPEEECVELGKIESIVEQLVVVSSIPGTAALDLNTVLFLDKGKKVLGEVFDVLGQVNSPMYCIRFNSNKQIKEREIEIGQTVYVAPRTEHTQFVILPNLLQIRGSDASWENDVEPSQNHLDYSDDEEERNARKAMRTRNRNNCENGDSSDNDKSDDTDRDEKKRFRNTHSNEQNRNPHMRRNQQYHNNRPNYPNQMGNSNNNQFRNRNPHRQAQQCSQYPPSYGVHQRNQMNLPFNFNNSSNTVNPSWHMNYNNFPGGPSTSIPDGGTTSRLQNPPPPSPGNCGPFYPNPYAMLPPQGMQSPFNQPPSPSASNK